MFFLKWFTSSPPPPGTVTIMDMPDLVMREILKDVDSISILNLRKVNRAFQFFIDETNQIQFHLYGLDVEIHGGLIILNLPETKSNTKIPSKIFFRGSDEGCVIKTFYSEPDLYYPIYLQEMQIHGSNFKDQFGICLDGILKSNNSGNLKFLNFRCASEKKKSGSIFGSIFGCCTPSKRYVDSFDASEIVTNSVLDSLEKIIPSNKVKVEKLEIERFKLVQVTRLVDILKPENSEKLVAYQISKNIMMRKVERCNLKLNMGTSDFENMTPENLEIVVQNLTPNDVLTFKKIFLCSPHCQTLKIKYDSFLSNKELRSILGKYNRFGFMWTFDWHKKTLHVKHFEFSNCVLFEWIEKEEEEEPEYFSFFELFDNEL